MSIWIPWTFPSHAVSSRVMRIAFPSGVNSNPGSAPRLESCPKLRVHVPPPSREAYAGTGIVLPPIEPVATEIITFAGSVGLTSTSGSRPSLLMNRCDVAGGTTATGWVIVPVAFWAS